MREGYRKYCHPQGQAFHRTAYKQSRDHVWELSLYCHVVNASVTSEPLIPLVQNSLRVGFSLPRKLDRVWPVPALRTKVDPVAPAISDDTRVFRDCSRAVSRMGAIGREGARVLPAGDAFDR